MNFLLSRSVPFLLVALVGLLHYSVAFSNSAEEHWRIGNIAMQRLVTTNAAARRILIENGATIITRENVSAFIFPGACTSCIIHSADLIGSVILTTLPGVNSRDTAITYGDLCALAINDVLFDSDVASALQALRLMWQSSGEGPCVSPRHSLLATRLYSHQVQLLTDSIVEAILPVPYDADEDASSATSARKPVAMDPPVNVYIDAPAPATYALVHARSRILMFNAMHDRSPEWRRLRLLRSLSASAYADHFLQCMYASDHHMPDCTPLGEAPPRGLEEEGCREYYARFGVPFWFPGSAKQVILYGQGYFSDEQRDSCVTATVASLSEVFDVRASKGLRYSTFSSLLHRPDINDIEFGAAFAYFPYVLYPEQYENVQRLKRSVQGLYYSASASVLAVTKNVGFCVDATVGLEYELFHLGFLRTRGTGYETAISIYPYATFTTGIASGDWFGMMRVGAGLQIFDGVKGGVSWGASTSSAAGSATSFPVYLDLAFLSKPLGYNVGLEFTISTALSSIAPYDLRIGAGIVWF